MAHLHLDRLFLALLVLVCGSSPTSGGEDCGGVKCQPPPPTGKCEKVAKTDHSVTHPTGPKMDCCPLWKCSRGGGGKNFFTFHGLAGEGSIKSGSETVTYEEGPSGRSISSSGKGSHDAVASNMNAEDMDELQQALKDAGILM